LQTEWPRAYIRWRLCWYPAVYSCSFIFIFRSGFVCWYQLWELVFFQSSKAGAEWRNVIDCSQNKLHECADLDITSFETGRYIWKGLRLCTSLK
jgi:hypothetical protein